jgi:predicted alpha/beta superfamily hydrolase
MGKFFWYGVLAGMLPLAVGAATKPGDTAPKTFHLVVNVPATTPVSDTIYVTGDIPQLCEWQPDCRALKRTSPGVYELTMTMPDELESFAYKVTRGSWSRDATNGHGQTLPNSPYNLREGENLALQNIIAWKDKAQLGVTGRVEVLKGFLSPELGNTRSVAIWFPASYEANSKKHYPVIYAHDGQNLFGQETTASAVDWGLDEAMAELARKGRIREAIIVGPYSTADRFAEYDYTQKGDLYAKFLVQTLKPYIDAHYRTLPERESTFTLGSSMGGHISYALLWAYPDVFSRATAVSLPVFIHDQSIERIAQAPAPTLPVALYMDNGTYDGDEIYTRFNQPFYDELKGRGLKNLKLQYNIFPWANHNEIDWSRRVRVLLDFLLGDGATSARR